MEIKTSNTKIIVENNQYKITYKNKVFESEIFSGEIVLNNGRSITFDMAKNINSEVYESDIRVGVLTKYRDLKGVNFAFDTLISIDKYSEEVYFEWIVVNDYGFDIKEIRWPAPIKEGNKKSLSDLISKDYYVENKDSMYMVINETPWDVNTDCLQTVWLPSLGKMSYKRVLRYIFFEDLNKENLSKQYEAYCLEKGIKLTSKRDCCKGSNLSISKNRFNIIQSAEGTFIDKICEKTMLPYLRNIDEEYIDVSSLVCENLNECIHSLHKMTRKECLEERIKIFKYLKSKNKILVCVKCSDWAYPYIDMILNKNNS